MSTYGCRNICLLCILTLRSFAGVVATVAASAAIGTSPMTTNSTMPLDRPSFALPTCSELSTDKQGYVELSIQGIPQRAFTEQRELLQSLFRDVYNEISGMCLDPMQRVLQEAVLEDWDTDWGNYSFPFDDIDAVDQSVTTTYWSANVSQSGVQPTGRGMTTRF